jgi:cystathionine beta-lyase
MESRFDQVPDRHNPNVLNKWTFYPKDVLPMWVADMDFRAPPPILNALHKAIDHGVLGYELPSEALRETVAARMERLYGWKVTPEMIVAVTGIVSGFSVAASAFCSPKRGYLIQTPVYNEFHAVKDNLGIPRYEAPLIKTYQRNQLHYEIDWVIFEKQVRKASMFLLCNPHNPVGLIFSRQDLRRMAEICLDHKVLIVSDEIHSELLFGDQKFTPVAKLSSEIAQHSITLVSPSKTFNVPGLFCGFAIIPNPVLREKYAKTVDKMRLHVSSLGLTAARVAFSGACDGWLNELRAYLKANRDFLIDTVSERMPEIRITKPDATYLAWLDCNELVKQGRVGTSPFEHFFKEAKVAFSDGKIFGKEGAGFVRLNFGCTRSTLAKGLKRVEHSL